MNKDNDKDLGLKKNMDDKRGCKTWITIKMDKAL